MFLVFKWSGFRSSHIILILILYSFMFPRCLDPLPKNVLRKIQIIQTSFLKTHLSPQFPEALNYLNLPNTSTVRMKVLSTWLASLHINLKTSIHTLAKKHVKHQFLRKWIVLGFMLFPEVG